MLGKIDILEGNWNFRKKNERHEQMEMCKKLELSKEIQICERKIKNIKKKNRTLKKTKNCPNQTLWKKNNFKKSEKKDVLLKNQIHETKLKL